jgi:hypothetical protein
MTVSKAQIHTVTRGIMNFWNRHSERKTALVSIVTIAAVLVDYGISTFYLNVGSSLQSMFGIALFTAITVILYGAGGHYLLSYCKSKSASLRSNFAFTKLNSMTRVIQYALLILLLTMVVEMVFNNQYHQVFYFSAVAIGTLPAVFMQAFLGYKLLSWFKSDKRNIMILLLGLSAAVGSISQVGNIVILDVIWSTKPPVIQAETEVDFASTFPPNIRIPYGMFMAVALIAALFEWAGVAILLHHFSRKIGLVKYWLLVSLPAVGLLAGMLPVMITSQLNYSQFTNEMMLVRVMIVFGASSIYVMWAIGYLTVAKRLRRINQESVTASYMTISAIGIILLGYSFATPAFFATYPPYGVAAHSLLALGVYLFSFGFYASAVSVSQDVKLRQLIKRNAIEQLRLVGSIGNAQMEQDIQNKVLVAARMVSEEMKSSTGIEMSTSEEESKAYLTELLREMEQEKKRIKTGSSATS